MFQDTRMLRYRRIGTYLISQKRLSVLGYTRNNPSIDVESRYVLYLYSRQLTPKKQCLLLATWVHHSIYLYAAIYVEMPGEQVTSQKWLLFLWCTLVVWTLLISVEPRYALYLYSGRLISKSDACSRICMYIAVYTRMRQYTLMCLGKRLYLGKQWCSEICWCAVWSSWKMMMIRLSIQNTQYLWTIPVHWYTRINQYEYAVCRNCVICELPDISETSHSDICCGNSNGRVKDSH